MIEHRFCESFKRLTLLMASRKAVSLLAVLFVFALGSSCGGGSDSLPPPFTSEPQILMAPNPSTPLAGILTVTTDVPTRVSLVVSDGKTSWTIDFDEFSTDHSLTVLGFRPGRTHTIEVSVIDGEGGKTTLNKKIKVTTDPLPPGFPPIKVVSNPEKMEPGVTLFTANRIGGSFATALVAVDETGEVVWYHQPGRTIDDARRLSNGNIMYVNGGGRDKIFEIDMLGNIVHEWHAALHTEGDPGSIPVAVKAFHHEVFEIGNGNFLTLSVETRPIAGFPTSDTDPTAPTETATVAGDVLVEFAPDGTIVNQWSLLDILDPLRIGYQSLIGFWDPRFPEAVDGTRDWSHSNGVIYDPIDDSIIVSARHQDAVIKFSRATGELIWILGTHANWDPVGFGGFLLTPTGAQNEFFWQYHQHAPMVTPEGNILVFDNGNFRATPFDPKLPAVDNFSRAVEYSIDETTMEITQVWEYGQFPDERIYTPIIGDADALPLTGNVLVTFGAIRTDANDNPTENLGQSKGAVKIVEVTHTTPAEKVFELSIVDDNPEVGKGWQTYRSERLPSLYP